MGDNGIPPPLPPKQRGANNNNSRNYSQEDVDRALQEEKLAFERIKQQKQRQNNRSGSLRLGKYCILI